MGRASQGLERTSQGLECTSHDLERTSQLLEFAFYLLERRSQPLEFEVNALKREILSMEQVAEYHFNDAGKLNNTAKTQIMAVKLNIGMSAGRAGRVEGPAGSSLQRELLNRPLIFAVAARSFRS
jgi:hypothetical protein